MTARRSRIVRMLTRQLDASLTLDGAGGVTARLEFECASPTHQAAA